MATRTLLTLEEFERLPDDEMIHELSKGELISVTYPKFGHSKVALRLQRRLMFFVEERQLGGVYPETGYVLSPDPPTLRFPDLSFLSLERERSQSPDDYVRGAPELAVEIVSPSDSAEDLQLKIHQYLSAGAKAVWVIYPKTRSVHLYQHGVSRVLTEKDVLDAPELFPGWSMPVSELFVP
jgi:Uma2 family endonuclease